MRQVAISAGHYPLSPGACFGDFCEHQEALQWVSRLLHRLGGSAVSVPVGTLGEKVRFINDINAALALEVHFNGAWVDKNGNKKQDPGEEVGKGSETLYYPGSEKGKLVAGIVQSALGSIFAPDRGVKEGWYKMDKARGPDFFLAKTKCVSLIIEPEFIHNKDKIIEKRMEACEALAVVIEELLTGNNL